VISSHSYVSFSRRLAALLYDTVAVFTVLFFASFVPVIAGGGDAIAPGNPLFIFYLVAITFGYFGLCWTHGRTLGMQAWKIEIEASSGSGRVTWKQAIIRFVGAAFSTAMLGFGFLSALNDAENRTWHDRLSKSRLVRQKT
jgi:uncharacterized RDD family membrane protein YckC